MELEPESLVVQADAAEGAGKLIERLPELWQEATLQERRKLLLTMLDGVYIDAKCVVCPKAFYAKVLLVGSRVRLAPGNVGVVAEVRKAGASGE